MREIIKTLVRDSILGYIQGKTNDTIIGDVLIDWHGEFGSLSESAVCITKRRPDGRFAESDGVFIILEPYITKMKYNRWFEYLLTDITCEVMDRLDPESINIDTFIEHLTKQVFDITKIKDEDYD